MRVCVAVVAALLFVGSLVSAADYKVSLKPDRFGVTNLHVKGHTPSQDTMLIQVYCEHHEVITRQQLEPEQECLSVPIRIHAHGIQDEMDATPVVLRVLDKGHEVLAVHTDV